MTTVILNAGAGTHQESFPADLLLPLLSDAFSWKCLDDIRWNISMEVLQRKDVYAALEDGESGNHHQYVITHGKVGPELNRSLTGD
jgi:hypothetical protein